MVGYVILGAICAGLVVAGIVLSVLFGAAKKSVQKRNQAQKAFRERQEKEIELLKEACRGLARNAGNENATFIKALSMYEIDEETALHVLKANAAKKAELSDKEIAKLNKSFKKGL